MMASRTPTNPLSEPGTGPQTLWRLIRAALLTAAGAALVLGVATAAADQADEFADVAPDATTTADASPTTMPAPASLGVADAVVAPAPAATPTAAPMAVMPTAEPTPAPTVVLADTPVVAPAPALVAASSPEQAFVAQSATQQSQFHLTVNQSLILTTTRPFKTINLAQPDVADFNLLTKNTILLTGKKVGTTQLILWDEPDKPASIVSVTVTLDLVALQAQLDKLFPGQHIRAEAVNGSVMLCGHARSVAVAQQAMSIAKLYSPSVMDSMEIAGGQQVCLQVRFAEVSRTASSTLGINGAFGTNRVAVGSNIGSVNPTAVGYGQNTNVLNTVSLSNAVTLYGSGYIGTTLLEGFIQALRENDLVRILAEPNLITSSGEEADFLAGGSFPIPVAQGGGSGSAAVISVEYRDYGVKLKFIPVVLGNGRIRLKLAPEVSELDYANGVTLDNFVIPGTTQRRLSTTVELADGQTFAVAGLLQSNISSSKQVTPLLGDLPVLGALFRSVRYQNQDTELVVLVTPHLVEPMNPAQVPNMPGEVWESPTEKNLFLDQYLGGDRSSVVGDVMLQPGQVDLEHRVTPSFYGQVGFVAPPLSQPPAAPAADGAAKP